MYYVYLLINKKKSYKYVGITKDIKKRLRDHNQGKTRSTKPYRPFDKIIILDKLESRKEAREREKYFKSATGRKKRELILNTERSSVG
ncbi:GIY-YIG nuclease family protein [Candidatus Dojkabacteria bacterium]|nr:GIY-YIG nuclease family protein [Candidatus Dojkabacteria bacterium]